VIVCPVIALKQFVEDILGDKNEKEREKWLKELHRGNMPAYHLLDKLGGTILPKRLVTVHGDFRFQRYELENKKYP
jgi:hypothetical protein